MGFDSGQKQPNTEKTHRAPTVGANSTVESTARYTSNTTIQRAQQQTSRLRPTDVINLQRSIGNQATSRLLRQHDPASAASQPTIQRSSLVVGAANDPYEREAEDIASSLNFSSPPKTTPTTTQLQRTPAIQRSAAAGAQGGVVENELAQRIQSAQKGGSSLSTHIRRQLEPRLGANLGGVKIHTDSQAIQLTREVGAKAFTHKNHIYYGAGQSPSDLKLTAHETVHTIQQGAVSQLQRKHDTTGMGVAQTATYQPPTIQRVRAPGIQRLFGLSKKEKAAKRERQNQQQAKINDAVLRGSEYERRLGKYLFNHPRANDAAKSMLDKMRNALLPEFNQEDKYHQDLLGENFGGTKKKYAGNVGRQFTDVLGVFENGNLRERMTAFYNAMFGGFKPMVTNILKTRNWQEAEARGLDPRKMRIRARQLGYGKGGIFGSNIGAKKDGYSPKNKEIYRNPRNPLDRKNLQSVEDGLLSTETRGERSKEPSHLITNRRVGELEDGMHKAGLSERERKFMFNNGPEEDISGQRLPWEEGGSKFQMKDNSPWVKRLRDQLHMPLTAGPSGTALRFYQIWEWLGKPVPLADLNLALLGWMLVENDHSLHEIMSMGADYGLAYTPGQEAYKHIPGLTIAELRSNVCLDPQYPKLFPDEIDYQIKMANGEFKLATPEDLEALQVTESEEKWERQGDEGLGWVKGGKENLQESGKVTKPGSGAIKAYTGLAYLVQNPVLKKSPRFVKWLKVWHNLKTKNEMTQLRGQWTAVGKAQFTVSDLMREAEIHNRMLHQALAEMPEWTGTVYRGGGVGGAEGKYKKGTEITFSSFTSTSENESTARTFANKARSGTKVIFEIQVTNGRNISPLSLYPKGREVLLPPGSKFEVVDAPEDYEYKNPFTNKVEGQYLKIKLQQIA